MRFASLLFIGLFAAHCSGSSGSDDLAGLDLAAPDLQPGPDLSVPLDLAGACPTPSPGKICVQGTVRRIIDDSALAQTDEVLVQIFDPLAFGSDPHTTPLASVKTNGTFVFPDLATPTVGLVALVARDPFDGVPDAGSPRWLTTATTFAVTAGTSYAADAWATLLLEAETWSFSGTDYATGGALVVRYFNDVAQPNVHTAYETMPAAGVDITIDGTVSGTAKYFLASLLATPGNGNSTGTFGAAIDQVDSTTHQLSGKSTGVGWETAPVSGVPGVILFERLHKM
jgi:hypothetical protein